MKITTIEPDSLTRNDWIAQVLALAPGATECTPVRRDCGESVVFRRGRVQVDAEWRTDAAADVAAALTGSC